MSKRLPVDPLQADAALSPAATIPATLALAALAVESDDLGRRLFTAGSGDGLHDLLPYAPALEVRRRLGAEGALLILDLVSAAVGVDPLGRVPPRRPPVRAPLHRWPADLGLQPRGRVQLERPGAELLAGGQLPRDRLLAGPVGLGALGPAGSAALMVGDRSQPLLSPVGCRPGLLQVLGCPLGRLRASRASRLPLRQRRPAAACSLA